MAKKVDTDNFFNFATTFFPDEAEFTDAQVKVANAILEGRVRSKPVRMVRAKPKYTLLPWVYGMKAIDTPKIINSHHFST